MNTITTGVTISPVNMDDRKNLGIKAGDTVKVHQKIQDKGKTRIQIFEGIVLARKHGAEPGATFTVRKVASGVGVEKIFPLYSPNIDMIEIVRRSKVRRSKLYFIREKVARQIKRQMRRMSMMTLSTESEAEAAANAAKLAQAEAQMAEDEAKAAQEAAVVAEEKAAQAEEAQADHVEKTAETTPEAELSAEKTEEMEADKKT